MNASRIPIVDNFIAFAHPIALVAGRSLQELLSSKEE